MKPIVSVIPYFRHDTRQFSTIDDDNDERILSLKLWARSKRLAVAPIKLVTKLANSFSVPFDRTNFFRHIGVSLQHRRKHFVAMIDVLASSCFDVILITSLIMATSCSAGSAMLPLSNESNISNKH